MSEVGINISCWSLFRPFRRKHKNIQAQRKAELEVTQSGLSDHISDLPDEILCHILSFLTLRDSVRTRLLAARWRYLCDCRSLLHFDALNVFGRGTIITVFQQPKFVSVVNQFIQVWKARKDWNVHGVKIHFPLYNEYTSHIDRWIQSFISMGIKDLDLNTFSLRLKQYKPYVLSSSRLVSREASYLKCLSLGYCALRLTSECTSWINHLTTLDLYCVDLRREETECILSNALSLTSLSLFRCLKLSSSVNVKLPCLQKLVLDEFVEELVLNCPSLEILKCSGAVRYFKFLHVPLLREVNHRLIFHPDGCSSTFGALTRHAPNLQELSLFVNSEVSSEDLNDDVSDFDHKGVI